MIQPETILRDTALALLPLIGVGALLDGAWGALGVLCTGVVVLANLWVLGRLIRRLTASMAGEDDAGGLAVFVYLLKFPLLLGVAVPLVWAFGGLAVAVAFSALVFAVFVRGVVMLFQPVPGDEALPADAPQGSP